MTESGKRRSAASLWRSFVIVRAEPPAQSRTLVLLHAATERPWSKSNEGLLFLKQCSNNAESLVMSVG